VELTPVVVEEEELELQKVTEMKKFLDMVDPVSSSSLTQPDKYLKSII